MRNSQKNTTLGYTAQIMRIIKFWNLVIPPVPLISPTAAQEFNKATLSHMGYRWDKKCQCLYFKEKGSNVRVYNFDIPSEQIYEDEDPVDADMPDINENAQPEANQAGTGWGEWVPNRWSPTNYQFDQTAQPHASPTAAAGSSSEAPAYLTAMFQQMEVANDSRHEEARRWHNQQSE